MRLILTHTAHLSGHWDQYGPGAVGVGWGRVSWDSISTSRNRTGQSPMKGPLLRRLTAGLSLRAVAKRGGNRQSTQGQTLWSRRRRDSRLRFTREKRPNLHNVLLAGAGCYDCCDAVAYSQHTSTEPPPKETRGQKRRRSRHIGLGRLIANGTIIGFSKQMKARE